MNPYLARITVLQIKPINSGNLKAFASVRLGSTMTINGCRIIQQAGQRAYVALPQTQDKDGRYFPVITADDPQFKEAVEEKVLGAWRDSLMTGVTDGGR